MTATLGFISSTPLLATPDSARSLGREGDAGWWPVVHAHRRGSRAGEPRQGLAGAGAPEERIHREPPPAAGAGPFLEALDRAFTAHEGRVALRLIGGAHRAGELTYGGLRGEALCVSAWLRGQALPRGAMVALLAESRPEWVVALLASMMAGATTVPLDPKLTLDELSVLLDHAAPEVLFASRAERERAAALAARIPSIRQVVLIDGDRGDPLPTFASFGSAHWRASCSAWRPCRRAPGEPALLVYTSGTTGNPEGVLISFGNLEFEARALDEAIGPQPPERFLSVLPLNHLYELLCGLFVPLRRGATITYHTRGLLPDDLAAAMREHQITSLVGVPLLFRAMKRGIEHGVRQRGPVAQRCFQAMSQAATLIPSHAARRVLFAPLLDRFGGALRTFYCGGAALDPEVATFFARLGVPICQGYGLTETSPVIATNTPRENRIGSVGRPLPGVEVRIAGATAPNAEGEIETRGPHVMLGYLRAGEDGREALDQDGWLRTGDIGRIDESGYLYVTGRCKDLIVLGGGKKVYPDEVEDALLRSGAFAEVCVLGVPAQSPSAKGFDEVCAVVVPGPELAAMDGVELRDRARAEVDRAALSVAPWKRPTRVLVRREPMPKTATRKLKRPLVRDWIRAAAQMENTV